MPKIPQRLPLMSKEELRATLEALTDGEFIDLIDSVCQLNYGLTATEWLEREYTRGKFEVTRAINELANKPELLREAII